MQPFESGIAIFALDNAYSPVNIDLKKLVRISSFSRITLS